MRIADAVIKLLYNNQVRYTFGIPTSQMVEFMDAMNNYNMEYIVVKNEAAASYSAGRYSDLKRDLGVCFLGGTVGVNNAINGIADAYRNKLPVLIISSVPSRKILGKNALQDMITTEITKPITKYSKTILDENKVIEELNKAIKIALTPPYGPVHISIAQDIQKLPFDGIIPEPIDRKKLLPKFDDEQLEKAINVINSCKAGIIMVGRGARGCSKEIKELSKKLNWPIITTPNGKGIINSNFKNNLGNYGFASTDGAIEYVDNNKVDCLLCLGTSLGQVSTRMYKDTLVKNKKVIHIDWDKSEFNKVFKTDIPVFYDIKTALNKIIKKVHSKNTKFIKPIINHPYIKNHSGLSLRLFMEKITELVPENTNFIQDMGENMNFSFKYLNLKEKMSYQTSLNYASMGVAIGGAIGSYLAEPHRQHAVIVGDGSFYMNGMEILTAKEYNMPIIYFVVNNAMYGLVKHGVEILYGREVKGKYSFSKISIANVAKAMGIDAVQITKLEQLDALKDKFHNLTKPLVVELITDGSERCLDSDRWDNKQKDANSK